MSSPEQRQIDWASAEVEDRTLTVGLSGEAGKGWAKRFNGVLGLLEQNAGRWGEITMRKDTIQVADVEEGSEGDVRHLLESVLLQVNSELAPGGLDQDASVAEGDPRATTDREMTATFRAFAGHDGEK